MDKLIESNKKTISQIETQIHNELSKITTEKDLEKSSSDLKNELKSSLNKDISNIKLFGHLIANDHFLSSSILPMSSNFKKMIYKKYDL